MNNNIIKSTLLVGTILVSNISISQKKNETSAAVAYKNTYSSAISNNNLQGAKKALTDAKRYIDEAASNIETKESPKTQLLKGCIYSTIYLLGTDLKDTALLNSVGPSAMHIATSAFKTGYNLNDKYKSDIKDAVIEKHNAIESLSMSLYNSNNFKEAAEMYSIQVELYDAINLLDTNSLFNSALCFDKSGDNANAAKTYEKLAKSGYKGALTYALASNSYRKNKQIAEAKAIVAEGRIKFPQDKEILLEAVNTCLEGNDPQGAESLLNEAISKDPKNKLLHLTIGSIYIDLKQNEKAEASINNALAIDPEYEDALYQLGAHLVTWAGSLIAQTNNLKYNDPKLKTLEKQAMEIYNRAISPLEKYIVKSPNDKNVLTILSQLYRNLGDSAKSDAYKARAKAL
jgi:Tfp pilus assembly protein PilF